MLVQAEVKAAHTGPMGNTQKVSLSGFERESLAYYKKLGTRNKPKMDM